jgi:hypothetical protein
LEYTKSETNKVEILSITAVLITVVGGAYGFWKKFIVPRLTIQKLQRFYALVEDWFDTIDQSNISDVNIFLLNNKGNKIRTFIKDNGLEYYKMVFPLEFRREFLRYCGIKEGLRGNPEMFEEYSRCPATGLYVSMFWGFLEQAFYNFKNKYEQKEQETNFADVEMRVKLLKMYAKAKTS